VERAAQEARRALQSWGAWAYGLAFILVLSPLAALAVLQVPLLPREFAVGLAVFCCMPTTLTSGVSLTQVRSVLGAWPRNLQTTRHRPETKPTPQLGSLRHEMRCVHLLRTLLWLAPPVWNSEARLRGLVEYYGWSSPHSGAVS